ncbi:MAG TPA: NADH-quinone oxidoreductase subunit N [Candidatus Dormibacteraeota bacterium]|nr:NADH-quinone oxidoreductase subunit N [Candidatus Dormibacteraeota bacterium]
MTINLSGLGIDYGVILPELIVVGTAIVVLFMDLFVPPDRRTWLAVASAVGLLAAGVASIPLWGQSRAAFGDTVVGDSLAAFFDVLLLAVSIVTVAISPRFLRALDLDYGEYYILLLGATAGMMLLAAATSLMTIFLGIELLSICLYVLSGFARTEQRSQESALKYLLLGGFATGFLLYGMALIYGATGSTSLRGIAAFVGSTNGAASNVVLLLGIGFLSVGLAFKASAAPFHMWTPDVYEGSPTIVTTFMSVATKSAAFAAVGRVFIATFPSLASQWYFALALIAMLSLLIGNLVAITQDNLKRMLAYSGVAHAGYILLGVLPGTAQGFSATVFYIAAYAVMNFGAFAVVTALGAAGEESADLGYWRGLFYRRPFLATVMTIFMLSLAGIPPTVGFFAKLFVFQALVNAHLWAPLIVAVIMTIISFYYYLRVVVTMLATPDDLAPKPARVGVSTGTVLGAAAAATIVLGVFPTTVLDWAGRAAASLHF